METLNIIQLENRLELSATTESPSNTLPVEGPKPIQVPQAV
ncbi:hypothetical protein [Chitinophaga vietnamensis]|nr:hypothetical protein [Chitinophaga vietnamensis]